MRNAVLNLGNSEQEVNVSLESAQLDGNATAQREHELLSKTHAEDANALHGAPLLRPLNMSRRNARSD